MQQFEKLHERVEAAVSALPYALNEEQGHRLQNELKAIKKYKRAEMLITASEIAKEFKDIQTCPDLYDNDGYGVSYVCWLLGISDFNPFQHPCLKSEMFALDTFKSSDEISMVYYKRVDWKKVTERIYGDRAEYTYDGMQVSNFKINVYGYGMSYLYQLEKSIRANVDPNFSSVDIPFDDTDACKLIRSNELLGILGDTQVRLSFIDALRVIQPTTFRELVDTLAITLLGGIRDIDIFVYNRDHGITEYTGIREVDEVLHQSNGILLYTKQDEAIDEIIKNLPVKERRKVRRITTNMFTEDECRFYTMAVDIYRRAYMKSHFPELFRQVLISIEEEKYPYIERRNKGIK